VISVFEDLLITRMATGIHTTEDGVRYTFFAVILKSGLPPEKVALEYPHPKTTRAQLDTVLVDGNGQPTLAVEFKYDREIPSGSATPRPMKAGDLFADLIRVSQFSDPCERLFVYVTDSIMATYLRSQPKPLSDFFSLSPGQTLDLTPGLFVDLTKTFQDRMGIWPAQLRIVNVAKRELPRAHHLRIYEIQPPEAEE
jgi:hypothetical protein